MISTEQRASDTAIKSFASDPARSGKTTREARNSYPFAFQTRARSKRQQATCRGICYGCIFLRSSALMVQSLSTLWWPVPEPDAHAVEERMGTSSDPATMCRILADLQKQCCARGIRFPCWCNTAATVVRSGMLCSTVQRFVMKSSGAAMTALMREAIGAARRYSKHAQIDGAEEKP